jgi:hypothetical protein
MFVLVTAKRSYEKKQSCQHSYLLSHRGNADQIPTEDRGASNVLVRATGTKKLWCTVMLPIAVDGRKLLSYVMFKRKTIPKGKIFFWNTEKMDDVRTNE